MEKYLGKIANVEFGKIGTHSSFGVMLTFAWHIPDVGGSGTQHFEGWFDPATVECVEGAVWTEADRSKAHDELIRYLSGLLNDAKVRDVYALKGVPVEVRMDNHKLASWRILTEVL